MSERLKYVDAQDDWPTKSITVEKEDMLLDAAYNYHDHRLSFEHSFAFTCNWNISMSSLMRHDNVEKACYEDLRASHDDGPYRYFTETELTDVFGCVSIEPAMDSKISAFGSKKASENSDVVGSYCHTQVNRCAIFAW